MSRQQAPTADFGKAEVSTSLDLQKSLRNWQRDTNDYLARLDLVTPTYENFTLTTGTTAGGLAAWVNRTNCDIIITEFVLDVRSATTLFGLDFGVAANATTAATDLLNNFPLAGVSLIAGTAYSTPVVCPKDYYITGSSNGGAATGTFGGEAYVTYKIRQPIV